MGLNLVCCDLDFGPDMIVCVDSPEFDQLTASVRRPVVGGGVATGFRVNGVRLINGARPDRSAPRAAPILPRSDRQAALKLSK